jgi:uncharacterized protein
MPCTPEKKSVNWRKIHRMRRRFNSDCVEAQRSSAFRFPAVPLPGTLLELLAGDSPDGVKDLAPAGDVRSLMSFNCRCCGACCRWSGYVRVTEAELDAIAAHLDMPVRQFIEACCKLTRDRTGLTIIEKQDGSCLFLLPDNRCRIQPVKPKQCRDFPGKWNFPGHEAVCKARTAEDIGCDQR